MGGRALRVLILKSSQVLLTEPACQQRPTPASPHLCLSQAPGGAAAGTAPLLGGFSLFSVRNWGQADGRVPHRGGPHELGSGGAATSLLLYYILLYLSPLGPLPPLASPLLPSLLSPSPSLTLPNLTSVPISTETG